MVRLMDKSKVFHTFSPFWSYFSLRDFFRIVVQNSLFPGFDTVTDLGGSATGVHSLGWCRFSSDSKKSASALNSMSAECVYDERFLFYLLKLLDTTHGLVKSRRKNFPSIKVETGVWPSFPLENIQPKPVYGIVFGHFLVQPCLFAKGLRQRCSTCFLG